MQKTLVKILPFIIILLFNQCNSRSGDRSFIGSDEKLSGKIIKIIDGDTYDILLNGKETVRVRMEGIDAPERGMPFYRVSKNYLAELCSEKYVTLKITGKDSYKRLLAFSYLEDGRELSHKMIEAGLAWHYKKYNSDADLANLEIEARKLKRGLWIDKYPMPPWVNKKLHRKGISTKDSFDIKPGQE